MKNQTPVSFAAWRTAHLAGRLAVIEYKGDAYASNDDSRDKKAVGRVWQLASGGKGVFVFVEKEKEGENMRAQMEKVFGQFAS